ncbi:MAG: tetratricopeptide repeat protein, partial [Bacteroidales bacterium]|nr:tetratricopeptide repeat protein [Bacteroidales bacterium]
MKKIFAILFLLFLPMWVLGQSEEAEMLFKKGEELYKAEKYEEAIPFFEKCESLEGKDSEIGIESIFLLTNCYGIIGNFTKAIKYSTQTVEIFKKELGEEEPIYASSLHDLAMFYYQIGNCQEAIKFGTQAMEIRKKVLGENNLDYAISLGNLALYYGELGNYQEAIRLTSQAIEIRKMIHCEEDPDYAVSLQNLATYYGVLGNNQEALKLYTQAIEIQKKVIGEEHPDYANSLSNMAECYNKLGNLQEAIKINTQAMEIRKKVLGKEHPDYASSLNNLSVCYSKLGNYQEAIKLNAEAMEIIKKVFGEEHPDYAMLMNNLANNYSDLGNYHEAIRLGSEAMEIHKKVFGEEHPDYAKSLHSMASFYFNAKQYEEATKYLKQNYNRYETLVLKTFAYLTNKERADYWNMYSNFFNHILARFATVQPNSTLKTLAINGQLLSKGLLLNADLEMQNLIETQDNEQLKTQYYKIKQDRKILDELYQLPINKRTMNADSLSKVIDNEERNLIEACQEIGDYTKNLSIKWTDVQQQLNDNDIAIEFTNFTENNTSNNYIYTALILKKGMPCAELVKLDYSETDTVDYTTPSLYNKIWKPLDQYLQDVQNVYFSPTGKFHNIGIEYLPDENGEIFAKKYSAYRLSSTRELAIHKTSNPSKKAAVFGGIVYDFDEADWQNVSNEEAERAGLTFLKGAKKESEEITQILSDSSFTVTYGTDKAATEESFKKISGSGIKILHIATHGFYEPENKENSFANLLAGDDENSQEDLSLSRSGLFLAGASTGLDPKQRKNIPDGVDDGILTAKEIS